MSQGSPLRMKIAHGQRHLLLFGLHGVALRSHRETRRECTAFSVPLCETSVQLRDQFAVTYFQGRATAGACHRTPT